MALAHDGLTSLPAAGIPLSHSHSLLWLCVCPSPGRTRRAAPAWLPPHDDIFQPRSDCQGGRFREKKGMVPAGPMEWANPHGGKGPGRGIGRMAPPAGSAAQIGS